MFFTPVLDGNASNIHISGLLAIVWMWLALLLNSEFSLVEVVIRLITSWTWLLILRLEVYLTIILILIVG